MSIYPNSSFNPLVNMKLVFLFYFFTISKTIALRKVLRY